jgi:hypothetical protein
MVISWHSHDIFISYIMYLGLTPETFLSNTLQGVFKYQKKGINTRQKLNHNRVVAPWPFTMPTY